MVHHLHPATDDGIQVDLGAGHPCLDHPHHHWATLSVAFIDLAFAVLFTIANISAKRTASGTATSDLSRAQ